MCFIDESVPEVLFYKKEYKMVCLNLRPKWTSKQNGTSTPAVSRFNFETGCGIILQGKKTTTKSKLAQN